MGPILFESRKIKIRSLKSSHETSMVGLAALVCQSIEVHSMVCQGSGQTR